MGRSGIERRRETAKTKQRPQYLDKRRDLIAAAARVFARKGLDGARLDDIAKEAGIDRASLYYYVDSKQEIFEEVVFGALVENIEVAERVAASDQAPADKMAALIEHLMGAYERYFPHLYVFVQEDASRLEPPRGEGRESILELGRRFDRATISIVEEGIERGEFRRDLSPRIVAYGVIGMVNWSHRWFRPGAGADAATISREFSTLVLGGLVATERS